jgi:DNA-binding response OmpR family regulator
MSDRVPPGGKASRATDQATVPRIYVVNGSTDCLEVIHHLMRHPGYQVTTSNFIPRSFEAVEASQPSLLIIDLVLGEDAGWNLLVRLRHAVSTRNIPVLLVSTTATLLHGAQDRNRIFHNDQYLLKPFDIDDLLLTIEDMIGKA